MEGYLTRFQYGVAEGAHLLSGVADAISNSPGVANYLRGGNWFITTGSADAITLVAPIAGGGFGGSQGAAFPTMIPQDDLIIKFISKTAFAHTITTPANAINGSKHIATFAAAVGNLITFLANGGVWWVLYSTGVTLT